MFQHIEFVTHVSYGFPPKPTKQSGHSQPQSAGLSTAFQKYYYNKSQHREDLLKSEYLGMRGFRDGPSGMQPAFFLWNFVLFLRIVASEFSGSAPVKKYVRKGCNILQKPSILVATESHTSRKLPTSLKTHLKTPRRSVQNYSGHFWGQIIINKCKGRENWLLRRESILWWKIKYKHRYRQLCHCEFTIRVWPYVQKMSNSQKDGMYVLTSHIPTMRV